MDNYEKGKLGEDYVIKLTEEKFLRYWCFPNPHDEFGNRKEICDLLILFKNIAIIISVKSYFLHGNYTRYRKKVVNKSSNQLYGAERNYFNNNKFFTVKHPDRGLVEINPTLYDEIYLITLNTGEQFENYELFDSSPGKKLVSVINKATFDVILKELDTIADLVEYLKEREQLLKVDGIQVSGREKDLLGIFLRNARKFPSDFFEKNTHLDLQGEWEIYDQNTAVFNKRLENRSSYFIDRIVRKDILKMKNGEFLATHLMSLNRFERRFVAKEWFSLVNKYADKENFLARRFLPNRQPPILLAYYNTDLEENKLDEVLQQTIFAYQYKKNIPEIIFLSATKEMKQYKFGYNYIDKPFSSTEIKNLEEFITAAGWFTNENISTSNENEY